MRWLGPLAAIAACHAEENRQLRTHVDYAPLAAKNGPLMYAKAGVACRRMHLSVHYHHDDPSDEGTLDGRPKSSRPKSSRRPAGGG